MSTSPLVHFVTLGCPKNEVDSARMQARVESSAYGVTDDIAQATVVVLNTCSFIQPAVEEAIETTLQLVQWRDEAASRRLVVAGCLPSRYGADLEAELPEPDAFLPVSDEDTLLDVLERLTDTTARAETTGPMRAASGHTAYLQISDGCFRHCTYCTIPSIRGPYRSRPLADIRREAVELIAAGAREIILIGQDTGAYGRDLETDKTLVDVLRALAALEGLAWLRVMYLQPDGITDELLETMARTPEVCRYIDMPLQHIAPRILKAMHRSGSAEEYLALIRRIREAMPDVILRTSLIAGFPGETDANVADLVAFLREAQIDYVGVFPFSPEEGTLAAELDDQLSERTRMRRAQTLRDAADEIGLEAAAQLIGRQVDVLSDGLDDDGVPVGRWRGQAPDVDGIVVLDAPVPAGRIVRALVTDTVGYDLEAETQQ